MSVTLATTYQHPAIRGSHTRPNPQGNPKKAVLGATSHKLLRILKSGAQEPRGLATGPYSRSQGLTLNTVAEQKSLMFAPADSPRCIACFFLL